MNKESVAVTNQYLVDWNFWIGIGSAILIESTIMAIVYVIWKLVV